MATAKKKKRVGPITRIENALDSKFFRRFMSVAYGLGASIVIIGALFKITHIKGANEALFAGMVTEAIIFALSALQKPHVEPDWSKVHPELLEDYHGKEWEEEVSFPTVSKTNQLDEMLQTAGIDQNVIERLGEGLKKLGDSASKLSDISDASVATNEYVTHIKTASQSVKGLSNKFGEAAEALTGEVEATNEYSSKIKEVSQAASGLKTVYTEAGNSLKEDIDASEKLSESIKTASESAAKLSESYYQSAKTLAQNIEALQDSANRNTAFNEHLNKLSENLASLNALYELQLKSTDQQAQASEKLQQTLENFLSKIDESANKTLQYQQELDALTKRMAALNSVYTNMLSAMNVK
jgi:gliding motility-associated protein GldL